jgi:alanyl-tRNA synthetase
MKRFRTGSEIRQSFIDFFTERGHTVVASSSLVPGNDQTLLFTNAGMVQFKDVFLGTETRPYTRAVDSQKCMRVAGKHNDLDDVGRDGSHHTFFEMLGNWSFGDYYKKEAIAWAWELLTHEWGLDKNQLWTTCFKDEKGDIPTDEEARKYWLEQPGINPDHILYFGRKENFWEMAETGPCGPDSEIHIDLGDAFCDRKGVSGHVCRVNGDCKRFLELWNLVFIQYNRLSPTQLEPLQSKHVDTGMGLDRVVSIIQEVYSNYETDLLLPLMDTVQKLTKQSDEQRQQNLTAYRVIADHGRAAAFLIADGVIPGNVGRNYVCRMIIRRAALFGTKIGLEQPFMAEVAKTVIENYGKAYPELERNKSTILDGLTREEKRFRRTVEAGLGYLYELFEGLKSRHELILDGKSAFELYATHGLPLEITRDIALERGLDVDVAGFHEAMEEHRMVSGAGKAMGQMGGEDVGKYNVILDDLIKEGKLDPDGVEYDPYDELEVPDEILEILHNGTRVESVMPGDRVEVITGRTPFYFEGGGQVSDTGHILSSEGLGWDIVIKEIKKPSAGIIIHSGVVIQGEPKVGDGAFVKVDAERRLDIMRNHTATHLLHAELHAVLGEHARQAGSLVAPDRLRFDFTHPEALTADQLERIEAGVNRDIQENYRLKITYKPLTVAVSEGAMALFGEKYGDTVRTITIGDEETLSYELCGGTHVDSTGDIGIFLITSEGSVAAGIRRIEAVTGKLAYELVQNRFKVMKKAAAFLECNPDEIPEKIQNLADEVEKYRKQSYQLRKEMVSLEFDKYLEKVEMIDDVPVLAAVLSGADSETLRSMTDRFRERYPSGIIVLGSVFDEKPVLIAAVTKDLHIKGYHAGELVKEVARIVGGGGGGRPDLAQAGGKDASRLPEAIAAVGGIIARRKAPKE